MNAFVTVNVALKPLSEIVTAVTAFSAPSTVTVKSPGKGLPDTDSENPITTEVPPRPAFCDVIVGSTSSMAIVTPPVLA